MEKELVFKFEDGRQIKAGESVGLPDNFLISASAIKVDQNKDYPVVVFNQNQGSLEVIGKTKVWKEGDDLKTDIKINPHYFFDKAFKNIKSFSVSSSYEIIRGHWGNSYEGEDSNVYYYDEVELLDISLIPDIKEE